MIAAIPNGTTPPCVIYWTGRVRLSVQVKTWCGLTRDASDGVLQLPEDTEACPDCKKAIGERKPIKAAR